jgi:cytochrome P450
LALSRASQPEPGLIDYDPYSPEVIRDPLPFYARLRDEAPAYYIAKYDCWALSRFADVWAVSSDTERFTVTRGTAPAQVVTKEQIVTPMLNSLDPPAHSVLRAAVRPRFLPRALRESEAAIRAMIDELLAPLLAAGGGDVVAELGSRLSTRVACLAIGLPITDGDALHRLVGRFFTHDPEQQGISADGWAAMLELNDYCLARVREERRAPSGGREALPALCAAELDGRRLADEEAASHVSELVVGGSVTFPKVLANGLVRLAEHPDQRTRLTREPSALGDAFDEIVRFDMPTQFLCRTVTKPLTLHGQRLTPGQGVLMLYPSANRDEREFASPDVFDVARRPARIASFGAGQHACLGQHVAKLEGRLCLEAILARVPHYAVDLAGAERHHTEFVQGFAKLPITF